VIRALAILLATPLALMAQTGGDEAAEHHAAGGHGLEARNEVMLFVGDTRKGDENEFTVGFDYLRSVGHHWGVGIFLDYARGEFEREYIAGAGAFVAPIPALPDLHLFAGTGWERLDEDHAHGHMNGQGQMEHDWQSDDLLIGRVGGSYVLHFGDRGQWVLAPQAFYDIVEGSGRDAVVFGLGLGLLF